MLQDLLQADLITVPTTMMPGGDLDATQGRYFLRRIFQMRTRDLRLPSLLCALLQGDLITVPTTTMPGGDLDATLCRYLRARKWDVQKAFVMIKGENA